MTTVDLALDPGPLVHQLRRSLRSGGPLTFAAAYLKFLHLSPALIHYFRAPRPLLQGLRPGVAQSPQADFRETWCAGQSEVSHQAPI